MDQVSFSANQFGAITAPKVSMLNAGDGLSVWALGILVTLKALSNETGGSYALFEDVIFPGQGPPAHIHTKEEETWYILEGELMWTVGGHEFHAKQGSFIHLPRFVPHTFANKFDKPARMVLSYAPGGFEQWFLDIGKPVTDPQGSPPETTQEDIKHALNMGKEYGIIFIGHGEKEKEEEVEMSGTL